MSEISNWKNSFEAYWWVMDHPKLTACGCFTPWIDMTPHMVNPLTNAVDDDPSLNTKQEWWIECGPYVEDEYTGNIVSCHDWQLDCGGDTIDEALLKLAYLVLAHYGDYEE